MAGLDEKFGVGEETPPQTTTTTAPNPDEVEREDVLFGLNVQPFSGVAAPGPPNVPEGSAGSSLLSKFPKFGQAIPQGETPAERGKGMSYVTIPPLDERQVARITFNALTYGSQINPFASSELLKNADMLAGAAEMAYHMNGSRALFRYNNPEENPLAVQEEIFGVGLELLSENPDWMGEFADTYWQDMLVALNGSYSSSGSIAEQKSSLQSHETMMRFKNIFQNEFAPDEWDLIYNIVASIPDADELLKNKGLDESQVSNPFERIVFNIKMAWKAPEAIRPYVNDPRTRLLNLAESYWRNSDPTNPAARVDFFNYLMSHANASIADVERIQDNGFFALAAGTVDIIPTVALDFGSDASLAVRSKLPWSVGPSEYAAREGLSWGENATLGLGFHANDASFHDVSGTLDAAAQIFADPQNLIFGAASASKAARQFPRIASRSETLRAALNPFSKQAAGLLPLHAMDTNVSTRLFYSVMSKTTDELLQGPRAVSHFEWMAKTTSGARIATRYPDLSPNVIRALEEANTIEEAREVWRFGMHGDEVISDPVQAVLTRLNSAQVQATDDWLKARRAIIEAEDDFNISRLGFDDDITPDDIFADPFRSVEDPIQFASVAEDVRIFDETVTARLAKNGPRMIGGEEVLTASIRGGKVTVRRGAKGSYAAFVDGKWAGSVENAMSTNPQAAVAPAFRSRGVGTRLLDALSPEELANVRVADSITPSAKRLIDNYRPGKEYLEGVIATRAPLEGKGGRRVVVSSLGQRGRKLKIESDADYYRLTRWLDDHNHEDVSNAIVAGAKLRDLDLAEMKAIQEYGAARGADMLSMGDEAYIMPEAKLDTIWGVDGPKNPAESLVKTLPDEYYNMKTSQLGRHFANKKVNGDLWVIHDLPSRTYTSVIRDFGTWVNKGLPKKVQQGFRRTGFVLRHKLPSNIDMANPVTGAKELKDWSRAMGLSDEWSEPFIKRFTSANAVTRKAVLDDWLLAAGDELGQPWLKYNLISRVRKGGVNTFERGVDGSEIGLMKNGEVTPMTLSHMASTYMMPDAKELLTSMKRYRQTSPVRLHRGLVRGTKSRRAKITANLQTRMRRAGYSTKDLSAEDWARMAYSDAFASEVSDIRGAGAGVVNKVATAPVKLATGFGSFFSISQLAGRPIAWNSRVLIEESIRDLLMGNTAMLRNPAAYFSNVWDAASIRRLDAMEKIASDEVTRLTAKIWDAATQTPDVKLLSRMFPDIDITGQTWTKGDIASLLSKELRGGRNFKPTRIGARTSGVQRAYRNNNRIKAAKSRIAEYDSIDETFRWNIDGTEIANRSYTAQFVEEVGASSLPLEWTPGNMSPHQIDAYGHGYGRQTKQMLEDPVVGPYGVNRMASRLRGENPDAVFNADRLVMSGQWDSIEYMVDTKLLGDGIDPLSVSRAAKAQYYLDEVVDNISETLYRPLIDEMDEAAAANALESLRRSRTAVVSVGGEDIVLNVDEYGAAKNSFIDFTNRASAAQNRAMPKTIAAYFEPRFGEIKTDGALRAARKFVDREMMFFGETTTQVLHRQPAFLAAKEQFFKRYKALGWSDDVAQAASSHKAAVVTNYIFFDNSAIPQVLHDMNKVIPFFSAMFEVAQTWAYKIPMMSYYGFGLAHMVRRVDRTLSGMFRSGLLDYDAESGQMTFTAANDPDNNSRIMGGLSRGVNGLMRTPIHMMEWASNMLDMANGGGYESADFSSWYKDGFRFSVGNPLDPTSYGVMAVNQFSVGFTPALQAVASQLARSAYAWDDELIQTEGGTLEDYLLAHPEMDVGLLMAYNQEAFESLNGKEKFKQAKMREITLADIEVPDELKLPKSSWWETMLDNTVFPFGKYRSGWAGVGDGLTAPIPSALSYVARGWGMTGQGNTNDWLGMFFGAMSSYQAHAELATQIQMLEASEGLLTRSRRLAAAIEKYGKDNDLEVLDTGIVSGGDGRDELQTMVSELRALDEEILRRATGNAAGALQTRGILGMLGPVSPRSYTKEQDVIAQFWAGKDLAEEIRAGRGSIRKAVGATNISSLEDMFRLSALTQEWLADDTGDGAKLWLKENMPGIEGFLQGKTFYGTVGISPITESFEDWNEGIEAGTITGVPPEVYLARHQYAAVANDKQFAIINRYGDDVDIATQRILSNGADYYDLVDEFNIQFDAVEFMDSYMYGGAYKNYRNRGGLDAFTQITQLEGNAREFGEALDALEELFKYGNLSEGMEREVMGDLRRTYGELRSTIKDAKTGDTDFRNPLEQNLYEYDLQVKIPYLEAIADVYDNQISTAETDAERSAGYRELRRIQDEWFARPYEMESITGEMVAVPPPMVRAWNSKTEEEKAELLYVNLSKRASWLDQFEVSLLAQQFPNIGEYFPNRESLPLHDAFAEETAKIRQFARENPDRMTLYERDQAINALEEGFEIDMKRTGRTSELEYDEAVPLQRLAMIGALPETLTPVIQRLNTVLADLKVKEKSPTTQYGRTQIIRLVDQWLVPQFFAQNPQAERDFYRLGSVMFDEDNPEVLFGIMLQGRLPLSRKLQ